MKYCAQIEDDFMVCKQEDALPFITQAAGSGDSEPRGRQIETNESNRGSSKFITYMTLFIGDWLFVSYIIGK